MVKTELDELPTELARGGEIVLPPSSYPSDIEPARSNEKRGMVWVIGAFAICPCHLPFTLGLLATLLGGTSFGVALQQYPVIAGIVITSVWIAATWRGFRYLRATNSLKTCQVKPR